MKTKKTKKEKSLTLINVSDLEKIYSKDFIKYAIQQWKEQLNNKAIKQ